jgi:SAM-dependent methyltransferase
MKNVDEKTVAGFGDEWSRFQQDELTEGELLTLFEQYFGVFPFRDLPEGAKGADFGCGSGRWAKLVAPKVGSLACLDASADALAVARTNLAGLANVTFHHASVSDAPIEDGSLDFAYSLGVLHHVPDTEGAIAEIAKKIKPGGLFLVYLYYALDGRPAWYQELWKASDIARRRIAKLPHGARYALSQALAASVYWPLARSARALDRVGVLPPSWPLAYYRDRSFYTMRTDALDRFGTRLEKRYTKQQVSEMLNKAGFTDLRFSEGMPRWVCVARKP